MRERADFWGGPVDRSLVTVGREAFESLGVSRSDVEEERGCRLGGKPCDGGGRGDRCEGDARRLMLTLLLLTGGGVPEGAELPERRSSHILTGRSLRRGQLEGSMRPDRSSTAVITGNLSRIRGKPGQAMPNLESAPCRGLLHVLCN